MSFILDALRKSESERQREALPSVMRMPGPAEPARLPRWAAGTMAGLGLAIVGLGVAWWLSAHPAARFASVPAGTEPSASLAAPAPAGGASPAAEPASEAAAGAAAGSAEARRPAAAEPNVRGPAQAVPAVADRHTARGSAAGRDEPSGGAEAAAGRSAGGSADRGRGAAHEARAPGPRPSEPGPEVAAFVPAYAEAASQDAAMPKLHLDLLAFDADPARRFVFIDGQKYVEGETLKAGPRVLRITADGAILLFSDGRQYLLGHE